MDVGLPEDLKEFLSRHISSIAQLELLFLLRKSSPRQWLAEEMGRELRIDPAWSEGQAMHLYERGLLACEATVPRHYWYQPIDVSLERAVTHLRDVYAERSVSIITYIYSGGISQARVLSDAFLVRRERRRD